MTCVVLTHPVMNDMCNFSLSQEWNLSFGAHVIIFSVQQQKVCTKFIPIYEPITCRIKLQINYIYNMIVIYNKVWKDCFGLVERFELINSFQMNFLKRQNEEQQ